MMPARIRQRASFALYAASVGFFSLLVQVVAMRELLTSFFGNELVIGLVLADWLLLVALGAWLVGGLRLGARPWHLAAGHTALAGAIPFSIYVARAVGAAGWLPGLVAGPVQAGVRSAEALLLPCLLLGGGFAMAVRFADERLRFGPAAAAHAYALEALGAVSAGALFHFVLADRLVSAAIAVWMGVCALAVAGFVIVPGNVARRLGAAAVVAAIVAAGAPGVSQRLRQASLAARWRGFQLLESRNTRYGNIAVCRQGSQLAFYYDGVLAFTTEDLIANEELAHLALLAADLKGSSGRVLVIGGAFGGLLREIAKHPVSRVDYVELDGQAVRFIEKYAGAEEKRLLGPRLRVIAADPRAAAERGLLGDKYAAVLLNLPPPRNAVVARLYSAEFLARRLRRILEQGGVLVVRLPAAQTTLSRQRAMLHKSIYEAVAGAFECEPAVAIGEAGVYLLARPGGWRDPDALLRQVVERMAARRLSTAFVTPAYFGFMFNPFRRQMYLRSLDQVETPPTSDRLPICYRYYLALWARQYSQRLAEWLERAPEMLRWAGVLAAGLVGLLLATAALRPLGRPAAAIIAVAACGFAEMAATFTIMLQFQIRAGYLFHQLGLLTGLFMGGLAAGSWLASEGLRARKGPAAEGARRIGASGTAWIAAGAAAGTLMAALLPGRGSHWPGAVLTALMGAAPWAAAAVGLSVWRAARARTGGAGRQTAKPAAASVVAAVASLLGVWLIGGIRTHYTVALGALFGLPTAACVWLALAGLRGCRPEAAEGARARRLLAGAFVLLAGAVGLVLVLAEAGDVVRLAGVSVVCGLASLYAGVAGGAIYALAVALAGGETSPTAARVYAIDLVASSAGALAVAVVLVPVIGVPATCVAVGAIVAIGLAAAANAREIPKP